jgi:alkanesulfonate monooxygenase SsuD/methylene tetrahydromethanopterin reductase-like flavin-dependent oxidoreductase (luciferase family)
MSRTVSVILPVQVTDMGMAHPYVKLAAGTRSRRLWSGQSLGLETHAVFDGLSGMGVDLAFGSAVTLMPLRHPYAAALAARSVAALSGRGYVAGVGPGAASLQQALLGAPYRSPLRATGEYVDTMRTLLDGGTTDGSGSYWPTAGLALPPVDTPAVELGVGVLREGMARLAGRVADVAITWLTPLEHVRGTLLPALEAGAAERGRAAPRTVSVVHVVLDRPGRDRTRAALMACERHVMAPHYSAMLRGAGIELADEDPAHRAQALLDAGVIASGTPQDVAGAVAGYHDAGVDEVVLNLGGVFIAEGPGAAARDLTLALDAIGDV